MNWNVHEENVGILGLQGSGKTTLAKNILSCIPNTARLIISPQNPAGLYGNYGEPINKLEQINNNQAMLWTGSTSEEMFARICRQVMKCSNMIMVVDDCHEFCKKQKMPREWATLINSGRNRGITSIFISPSPNLVHNNVLQSVTHLYSFRFVLESQIEFAKKNFFGDYAYTLMPPQSRPSKYSHFPEIGKHDYLYRSAAETEIQICKDNQMLELKALHRRQTAPEPEPEETEEKEKEPDAVDS